MTAQTGILPSSNIVKDKFYMLKQSLAIFPNQKIISRNFLTLIINFLTLTPIEDAMFSANDGADGHFNELKYSKK